MELWMPPLRRYGDSSDFWKVSIAIFAFFSAWTWPSSNDSVNSVDTCWQVQPSSLSAGDMQNMCLSSGGGIYQPSAGGLSCVPEPYLQYVTHIMSNNSCPWSVLYLDSMQQCPLGTTPSTHRPSAAVAFSQCIAIANRANAVILQKQNTNTERPVFGACEIEVVDPDVSWRGTHSRFRIDTYVRLKTQERRKYLVELPYTLQQQNDSNQNIVLNDVCSNFAGGCEAYVSSAAESSRLYQSISASSAYFLALLKVDWQQETHRWIQKYAPPISKYLGNNLDGILRMAKSVDTILSLRLYRQGFRDRLDSLGDLCHRTTRAISIPTISTNRLLPQKSVWSFQKRVMASDKPSAAENTPAPALKFFQGPRQVLD